jgi:hypothetical protein
MIPALIRMSAKSLMRGSNSDIVLRLTGIRMTGNDGDLWKFPEVPSCLLAAGRKELGS